MHRLIVTTAITVMLAVLGGSDQYGIVQPALLFVWAGSAILGAISAYSYFATVLTAFVCSALGAVGILVGIGMIDPSWADLGIALAIMIPLASIPGIVLASAAKFVRNLYAV